MDSGIGLGTKQFPSLNSQTPNPPGRNGGLTRVETMVSEEVNNTSSSSSAIVLNGGNDSNPNPKNWRAIFPPPRPVIQQPEMKLTPPAEINGKRMVASLSEIFAEGIRNCENMAVGFFVGEKMLFCCCPKCYKKVMEAQKRDLAAMVLAIK